LTPIQSVWVLTTIIGIITALWAVREAWADHSFARRRQLSELAITSTREDVRQEIATLVLMLVAGAIAVIAITPIREMFPYIAHGIVAILIITVAQQLARRYHRRMMWRRAELPPRSDRDDRR
jgi:predicted branched-subunit amino acid permease